MSPFSGVATLAAAEPTQVVQAASGVFTLTWLLIALPLLGAAVLLLGGRRTDKWGHWLGVAACRRRPSSSASCCSSACSGRPPTSARSASTSSTGSPVGALRGAGRPALDQLSMTFVLLITGVGSLIHIYSVGYMSHDHGPAPLLRLPQPVRRLDAAAGAGRQLPAALRRLGGRRSGVVPAHRLLVLQAESAAIASKKAFVVNRVGDVGLSLAIMLMFATFGSVTFEGVFAKARRGRQHARSPRSVSRCCSRRAASRRSSRCSRGCSTRWRARPRSRPSSTRPRW